MEALDDNFPIAEKRHKINFADIHMERLYKFLELGGAAKVTLKRQRHMIEEQQAEINALRTTLEELQKKLDESGRRQDGLETDLAEFVSAKKDQLRQEQAEEFVSAKKNVSVASDAGPSSGFVNLRDVGPIKYQVYRFLTTSHWEKEWGSSKVYRILWFPLPAKKATCCLSCHERH